MQGIMGVRVRGVIDTMISIRIKGKDSMGIGIYYGIAEILPIHEQNPKEIFTTADKMVENNKKNLPL
jgi:hypothetical protein